jgi:DNA-binding response OmpR family regulator
MKKIIIDRSIMHAIGSHGTIFQRSNITTYPARTSEEILNLHGVHKADIIITDAELPLMGGVELCSRIRNDAGLKNVSIILICEGTEVSLARCRDAHANVVLPKPLDPAQLSWKVSELLLAPQRQDMRTLLHVSVRGQEKNSTFLGVSHNVSISGMLLESDRLLKKGDRMTCTFQLGRREIVAEAEVIRMIKLSSVERFHCGVRFVNLDMKFIILIEQFIKGRVKH